MNIDPVGIVLMIIVVLLSITTHEFAHCWFTDLAGDPTPRSLGRVTLNPLAHLDMLGTIFIVITCIFGYGFGWGKPSPMDPRKMRNPRWDIFIAVLAGPVSNLLQACLYAALFRILIPFNFLPDEIINNVLIAGVIINVFLAAFNLVPIFPLDGHWLIGQLLPEKSRYSWYQFQRRIGGAGVIILVILLDFGNVQAIFAPFIHVSYLLLGIHR